MSLPHTFNYLKKNRTDTKVILNVNGTFHSCLQLAHDLFASINILAGLLKMLTETLVGVHVKLSKLSEVNLH